MHRDTTPPGTPVTALRVTTTATADLVVVALIGDLDYDTQDVVARAVRDALADRPAHLVVDLADVVYCDSSGLRVLVDAAHDAEATGAAFVVRGAHGQTERALRLTGIAEELGAEPAGQDRTESRNAKNVDAQRDAASTWGP